MPSPSGAPCTMLSFCVLMGVLLSLVLGLRARASTATRLLTWLVAALTAYLAAQASVLPDAGQGRPAWLDWARSLPMLFGPLLYFHVASSTGSWLRVGLGALLHLAPFALQALVMNACAHDAGAPSCQRAPCEDWIEHALPLFLLAYTWAAAERLFRYRARAENLGALPAARDRIRRLGTTLGAFTATAILAVPVAWPAHLVRCEVEWRGATPLGAMLALAWLWTSVWLWPHTLRESAGSRIRWFGGRLKRK